MMNALLLSLLVPLLSAGEPPAEPPAAPPREAREALAAGHGAYLAGRLEEAAANYRYVLSLSPDDGEAIVSLALAQRDLGRPEEALPYWTKACLLSPEDPFPWLQRGWSLLGLRQWKEARKAFAQAAGLLRPPAVSAEAELGLALLELEDGRPRQAVAHLQRVILADAFRLPAAYYLLGEAARALKNDSEARQFVQEALKQDPKLGEAAWSLARLHESTGDPASALQVYRVLLERDPGHPSLARKMEKLARYVKNPLDPLGPVRRLAWPLVEEPQPGPASELLTIVLIADPSGRPQTLRRLLFVANTEFEIRDERLGGVAAGKGRQPWEILYRSDRRVYELKNGQGRVEFTTRLPFLIQPLKAGGTLLLRGLESVQAPPAGLDLGDRELRGSVEVVPGSEGFHLVHRVPLEAYLASVLSRAMPDKGPLEAQKALAVLTRVLALRLKENSRHSGRPYEFCDSSHCLSYEGVQAERVNARMAVEATTGEKLRVEKESDLDSHAACGGLTEGGVADSTSPWSVASPRELEETLRSPPPRDLNCQTSSLTPPAAVRWLRVIETREVEERHPELGALKAFQPGARTGAGRLLSATLVGALSSATLTADQIEQALSPSSLRSTLFTVTPLYKGGRLRRLLLWGAGTGHGRGLCRAGAMGLASLGRSYHELLSHYFPGARFEGRQKARGSP